ncbi:hypothetical protein [Paenibacillus sp. FSL F4-0097]
MYWYIENKSFDLFFTLQRLNGVDEVSRGDCQLNRLWTGGS